MVFLTIDTSTSACSAALCEGKQVLSWRSQAPCPNHASTLPVFIEELLAECQSQHKPIEMVVLSEGPGSYTGLRISASLAKGLCYGRELPFLPVSTLEVLCMAAQNLHPEIEADAILCPMLDARRMEVYTGLYNTDLMHIDPIQALVVEDDRWIAPYADRPVYFFGNGADKCQKLWKSKNAHFIDHIEPDARYIGALAEYKLQQGFQPLQGKELAYYEPFYLKPYIAAPSHIKGLQ